MSNKQIFTDYDVYGFKRALALHAAKNNVLVEKWTNRMDSVSERILEIRKFQYPSEVDRKNLENLSKIQNLYSEFLDDLRKPCDSYSFISDFEWQNVGK